MTIQTSNATWTEQRRVAETVVYTVDSPLVGDRLEITVARPPTYETTSQATPVLYVLDPFLTLEMVIGASRLFGRFSFGYFPHTLVVGVGYPTRGPRQFMALRSRDLTPTDRSSPLGLPESMPQRFGGAPVLLRSLIEEIIPGIESLYRVAATNRTLIGWSFSGLFGLYVLFHAPETFSRYLLVSPSIWWDDAICFSYEEAWARQHTNLPARVFCAVGEDEEHPGGSWRNEMLPDETIQRFRQVSNLHSLVHRLQQRGYPNLYIDSVVFPGEYHLTVFPAALSRGLLYLFTGANTC